MTSLQSNVTKSIRYKYFQEATGSDFQVDILPVASNNNLTEQPFNHWHTVEWSQSTTMASGTGTNFTCFMVYIGNAEWLAWARCWLQYSGGNYRYVLDIRISSGGTETGCSAFYIDPITLEDFHFFQIRYMYTSTGVTVQLLVYDSQACNNIVASGVHSKSSTVTVGSTRVYCKHYIYKSTMSLGSTFEMIQGPFTRRTSIITASYSPALTTPTPIDFTIGEELTYNTGLTFIRNEALYRLWADDLLDAVNQVDQGSAGTGPTMLPQTTPTTDLVIDLSAIKTKNANIHYITPAHPTFDFDGFLEVFGDSFTKMMIFLTTLMIGGTSHTMESMNLLYEAWGYLIQETFKGTKNWLDNGSNRNYFLTWLLGFFTSTVQHANTPSLLGVTFQVVGDTFKTLATTSHKGTIQSNLGSILISMIGHSATNTEHNLTDDLLTVGTDFINSAGQSFLKSIIQSWFT